ncbi:MAG: enoyl-CoA hydratase/isomerase family protein [Hyphomicrobiales bacterium]|nr:enoyl-CoA hydratase/isomerase family protein [Hyphomicrobiales bacterium]
MESDPAGEVLFEKRGAVGRITLNRPHALNALTLNMAQRIGGALDAWERDGAVRCIVIEGVGGKAFSAGGDIRLLYEQGRAGDHAAQLDFWRTEYLLNIRIRNYPKPYVALIDGIVMGGGVGVSINGSHRIAGDGFAFAMPEVGIGFFPDVGATWFLPRLPGQAGAWLALTGARAKAGDALALGLAEAFVPSAQFGAFGEELAARGDIAACLERFAAPPPPAAHAAHRDAIDHCFAGASVADILDRLDAAGGDFAAGAAAAIRAKSPTSLSIAFRQMRVGAGLSFAAAMATEFRIVSRLCRGHDFYEGVRATIVDKDQKPQWSPATLADVDPAAIAALFAPLGADELPGVG